MQDIRKIFLEYFKKTGHRAVESSSLIPDNDPTLMFVNSGMVQFKNIFLGLEKSDYSTATTAQKCVRAGGKHNDLDNVGYTARHHSFFEMLGNFSFGDYFKEQAIFHAWQVVNSELQLPKDKLCVTVYHNDDEAYNLWKKIAGLSDEKIIRISTADNFWQMGDTGPCGPCSEIFYDHGDKIFGGPPGTPDADGDRFVEIWNLVFMQYEITPDGVRHDLPRPSIDTGMGLERITAVMEGVSNNYDTSLFSGIIGAIGDILSKKPDKQTIASFRVMADHLRAMAFLVADGLYPSNEGRGYVLRRIMRRAMRHAYLLGSKKPIFGQLLDSLITVMGGHYQELTQAKDNIKKVFLREEEQFEELLWRGMGMLNKELEKTAAGKDLSGKVAFQLYDTYGFPLDLTVDIVKAEGRSVAVAEFEEAMAEQKKRGKESWAGSGDSKDEKIWFVLKEKHGATSFVGYDKLQGEGKVVALLNEHAQPVEKLQEETGWVILDQTVFYGESGGQKGDKGWLGQHEVIDTKKYQGIIAHQVLVGQTITMGDVLLAKVNEGWRNATRANHSATHLLHEALRQTLGLHVAQKGSLVAQDHLRFDFSHHEPITDNQLQAIEAAVNQRIVAGGTVETKIMDQTTAEKLGAIALFGEKYGDEVRVVFMGQAVDNDAKNERKKFYSIELCGGTHVDKLAEINGFMIGNQESVASGVRRIVAYTGAEEIRAQMWKKFDKQEDDYNHVFTINNKLRAELKLPARNQAEISRQGVIPVVKSDGAEVFDANRFIKNNWEQLTKWEKTIEEVSAENKQFTKQLLDKKIAQASILSPGDITKHEEKNIVYIAKKIEGVTGRELKSIIDNIKKQPAASQAVIVLLAVDNGKVAVAIAVHGAASQWFAANELATVAGDILGGSGGGKKDFAMSGGPNAAKLEEAMTRIKKTVLG